MYPTMNPMMNPHHKFPIVFPQRPNFNESLSREHWKLFLIVAGFVIGLVSLAQIEITSYRYIVLKERTPADLILLIFLIVLGVLHVLPSLGCAIYLLVKDESDKGVFGAIMYISYSCLVLDILILVFVSAILFMGRDGDFKELTQALFMITLVYFGTMTIGMLSLVLGVVTYKIKTTSPYHRVRQIELMPRYPIYPIY